MASYRGSPLGIRILIFLYRIFGYRIIRFFVTFIALFYTVVSRAKRHEMRGYYRRVGLSDGWLTYYRHVFQFALTIADRFIARQGMQEHAVAVERVNVENFEALTRSGGIVILSHLGNWAQSFKIFETYEVTLNIVMAEALDDELSAMENLAAANERIRIINMNEGMQSVVDIAGALQRKEVVIMMADRVVNAGKSLAVPFMGAPARFNSGPFEIGRMRNVPMVGMSIVRSGDERLRILISETFHPGRDGVEKSLGEYARFLETSVREYPLQWFNFYDFWSMETGGPDAREHPEKG
jgi:predicted LPLAT superfamily acyltransferase